MDVRLFGYFTTLSPLSHIGETESTVTYLVQEPILQPDGTVEQVFCYNGNAWRGQLRDLMAMYMLQKLGDPTIDTDAFHLLFSGGSIGGEQKVNVATARAFRKAIPVVSLLGGGVGSQIMPGKTQVRNSYPVCVEAQRALTHTPSDQIVASYADMTMEKSFTRKDDAKDDRIRHYIADAVPALEQGSLIAEPPKTDKPEKDGPATQMRMTSELLISGVQLETTIDMKGVSEVELGAMVSALHMFHRFPYIGGQSNRGHGLVDLEYQILDLDSGAIEPFTSVVGDIWYLSDRAEAAKARYDQHLLEAYDAMIGQTSGEIRRMLGARAS